MVLRKEGKTDWDDRSVKALVIAHQKQLVEGESAKKKKKRKQIVHSDDESNEVGQQTASVDDGGEDDNDTSGQSADEARPAIQV
eukprot:CAMPEP_0113706908 /NCGR_PEP_ID=MMETSP0038_2-20120614/28045_1 /TAXON_ID=2898 /ORGANISM="Cryptomonas paramecium" /LENGTH=83 /DNA_ID=CAMNT_0000632271 /DNA_START=133 /DNA_END=385 /DNA_ORIENTATION=- /assembly_acc=CAM_ASM_000170